MEYWQLVVLTCFDHFAFSFLQIIREVAKKVAQIQNGELLRDISGL